MYRRLVTGTVIVVAISLFLLTAGFFIALSARLESDEDVVLRARADALIATLHPRGSGLTVDETPLEAALDVRTWVYDLNARALESPRVSASLDSATARLTGVKAATYRNSVGNIRLLAVPVIDAGRRLGTVVVGISRVPYEHTERIALFSALVLDLAVLALVVFGSRRVAAAALRPVAVMTAQAADWSEHDPDRRFGIAARAHELNGLAATLDSLLGRLAASLRHERALSADIAHELRTPLARIRAEAEISLRHTRSNDELRAVIAAVVGDADQLQTTINTLLTFAEREADPGGVTCVAVEAIAAAVRERHSSAHGVELDVRTDASVQQLVVGCPCDQIARMLGPVLDNAVRYATSRAWIELSSDAGFVRFIVRDDGPGVSDEEAEKIFEPGARGRAARDTEGTGLGLTLARRLARAIGGDVTVTPGDRGRFELRLPTA